MKQDDRTQPLFVAKPTSRLAEGFNLGVDPLCGGVGDSMFAVGQNTLQMGIEGVGHLFHRLRWGCLFLSPCDTSQTFKYAPHTFKFG